MPHIGDSRVPDALVSRLSKILQQGSRLYEFENDRIPRPSSSGAAKLRSRSRSSDLTKVDHEEFGVGKTDIGTLVPRERFSYWCFDLLFLICSNVTSGAHQLHGTALSGLPSLQRKKNRESVSLLSAYRHSSIARALHW